MLLCVSVAILWFCGVAAQPAEANAIRGVGKVLMGVLQVPVSILAGTFSGPPIVGTVFGAVNGIVQGIGLVASGALDIVSTGVAVAKTVGPYLLPFLL